jgi:hypothetical protein
VPYVLQLLARIHTMAGNREKAIDNLERMLGKNYEVTPAWARIDPAWAPLRGHPRFERLVGRR